MALLGITRPEKLIIPLFFNKKERGELARLFRPDSVLKHLMDEWKEDSVAAMMKEEISVAKYLKSRVNLLKSPKLSFLKQLDASFKKRIHTLLQSQDSFTVHIQQQFTTRLAQLDNEFLLIIMQHYAILEEHKRLTTLRAQHVRIAVDLKREVDTFDKKLRQFATLVEYETWGAVNIAKLEESGSQYNRLEKAVVDNAKNEVFGETDYSGLKLMAAYRIENDVNLKEFNKQVKSMPESMVKGMFISLRKKHVMGAAVLGVKTAEFMKNEAADVYHQCYYRLPESVAGKSIVEEHLRSSEGITSPLVASTSSTLDKDKRKLAKNENSIIYLVLARVLVPKGKVTTEYTVTDLAHVFPEYVIVCSKEKTRFEVVPDLNMIVPAKLCDLDYENRSKSNSMPVHIFYSQIARALEASLAKRTAQRIRAREIAERLSIFGSVRVEDIRQPLMRLLMASKCKLEKELQEAKHETLAFSRAFAGNLVP